jgi:phosphomannomutase
MAPPIKFGTEGWRAIMAEEFTAPNVRIVAQAIAEHYRRPGGRTTVAVGYDTRFQSEYYARAAAEVLAANGMTVLFSDGMVPTCAVSRYVKDLRLPAGVMITASHNPPAYNGLKVKAQYGGSATSETVARIERRIGRSNVKRVAFDEAAAEGRIRIVDLMPKFLSGIRSFVNLAAIKRSRLRVVVDSMHGAGGRRIEELLRGGRCAVETLRAERDPLFGGGAPEPIAKNLTGACSRVRRTRAHLGIANDGDADRVAIISPDGTRLHSGILLCVLLQYLVENKRQTGSVATTISNTVMVKRMAGDLGLKLWEVPVGFKYVVEHMLSHDVLIGGEETGGIGIRGYLPERDGILNGLFTLEAIAVRRQGLGAMVADLQRRYGRWHSDLQNFHLTPSKVARLFEALARWRPAAVAGLKVREISTMDGVKLIMEDDSWLLFRRSGTEPIVRIYAETPARSRLPQLMRAGIRLAQGA